jgi:hypothetical protein
MEAMASSIRLKQSSSSAVVDALSISREELRCVLTAARALVSEAQYQRDIKRYPQSAEESAVPLDERGEN